MATQEEKQLFYNFFLEKIGNEYGVAGLWGNIYAESGGRSNNLQNSYELKLGYTDETYTKAVDDKIYTNFVYDSAGYGLAQWTYYTRKQNLLNFVQKKGVSISDFQAQIEFIFKEISEQYISVYNILKEASNIKEASDAVMEKYERPATITEETKKLRAKYGQDFYNEFVKDSPITEIEEQKEDKNEYDPLDFYPIVCMMHNSTCYQQTNKMKIKGVLWHCTGANNPWIKRYVQPDDNAPDRDELLALLGINQYHNDWNHVEVWAGLNAWIGKLADGTVATVQTMPWDFEPWGCGGGCNDGWVQFEICEDSLYDKIYFDAVYDEAVKFTAYICKLYNIDPWGKIGNVPTILCHQDSYRFGMGSNHADVYNWFNIYGKTMDDVREDVAKLLGDKPKPTPVDPEYGDRQLYKGLSGNDVVELQKRLISLNYELPRYGADGDFGSETDSAVRAFQEDNMLDVDGIVGPNTYAAIEDALKKKEIVAGDIVDFIGDMNYVSANSNNGKAVVPGKAKITKIYQLGESKHPYHAVAIAGGGSNVYGWVNEEDVRK